MAIPKGSQVLATRDGDAAYFVDLSSSQSPAAIKERVFAKLGIRASSRGSASVGKIVLKPRWTAQMMTSSPTFASRELAAAIRLANPSTTGNSGTSACARAIIRLC